MRRTTVHDLTETPMPAPSVGYELEPPCTSTSYKAALRKVPAAVAIISAGHNGQVSGMTATAISSVSADPPMILACVHRDARTRRLISAAGRFSINFLADHQMDIAARFAQPELSAAERFCDRRWRLDCRHAPFLEGSIAFFECNIVHETTHGTHHVFIAEVNDVRSDRSEPLLYLDRAYRQLARPAGNIAAG